MVSLRRIMLTEITTQAYFEWILISLGLLYLVFDTSLATIYWILIGADFIFYYFNYRDDKVIQLPFERRTDNRLMSILTAVITYGIFLIISTVILRTFAPTFAVGGESDFMAVIRLMATTVPIFAGSALLSEYAFGIMIPVIESSLFFGRVFERIVSILERKLGRKIDLSRPSAGLLISILFCTAIFVLYHIGSKGLANVPLIITAIFAILSCLLVLKDKELKSAILFHIISNSIVIFYSFKFF